MRTFIRAVCLVTALFAAGASGLNAQTPPGGLAYERNNEGGVTITGYTGRALALVIPNRIEGLSVTTIGEWAFRDCTGLTSVTIPGSVTYLGYMAFFNCNGLRSVVIPSSVTHLGKWAFFGCTSLTSVTLSRKTQQVGGDVFPHRTRFIYSD